MLIRENNHMVETENKIKQILNFVNNKLKSNRSIKKSISMQYDFQ